MITIPGLSSAIKSALIAELGTPSDATQLQNFCDAMATGIVPYLIANVEVLPGIALVAGPFPGATTAPGAID
jgi:hypothetical protein